eukprot:TRINITY_DN5184_c0_g1_i3.p1 TRINITY_DN5184_c0_g1~~TRINITY_DN5184_c0_g1_i3.p1  ORF type:complete len:309 (-),score=51.98 TRINITY_DN5184_c0_g1_i3:78-1004(-)
MYTKEVLRILNQHNPDVPIYMYLAYHVVHIPLESPSYYYDINSDIKTHNRRLYASMMSSLDDAVGNITAKLLEKNMWDNTIFIFTTDNGADFSEYSNAGNNAPLRGGKFTHWQGGVRGTAFITSPLLPSSRANTSYSGMIHAVDWYKTLSELAGVPVDQTGPVAPDGVNIWGALSSGGPSPRTEAVINIWGNNSGAIRVGDFKLYRGFPGSPDGWVPRANLQNTEVQVPKPCEEKPCLFNVITDPTEHNDLSNSMPDKLQELIQRYDELAKSEVSLEESGLCPPPPPNGWPNAFEVNKKSGYWEPWAD